jgi:hypothetical protein
VQEKCGTYEIGNDDDEIARRRKRRRREKGSGERYSKRKNCISR